MVSAPASAAAVRGETAAWERKVIRHPLYKDCLLHVEIYTVRREGYTARTLRRERLKRLRDARADLSVTRESITQRCHDGRTETTTFHDAEPADPVARESDPRAQAARGDEGESNDGY